jgi:hypothetical protein
MNLGTEGQVLLNQRIIVGGRFIGCLLLIGAEDDGPNETHGNNNRSYDQNERCSGAHMTRRLVIGH